MNMELNKVKIKLEMERLGWNQAELSRRMGVHRQHLNRLLKEDDPPIGFITIEKISKALGIDWKDLVI
jgi:transcriptional regulator with XRE-family HTH domain